MGPVFSFFIALCGIVRLALATEALRVSRLIGPPIREPSNRPKA
jgi:hypothetical protein